MNTRDRRLFDAELRDYFFQKETPTEFEKRCLEVFNKLTEDKPVYNKCYMKARYDSLKSQGLCLSCRKPAIAGGRYCILCRDRRRKYYREVYAKKILAKSKQTE